MLYFFIWQKSFVGLVFEQVMIFFFICLIIWLSLFFFLLKTPFIENQRFGLSSSSVLNSLVISPNKTYAFLMSNFVRHVA